MRTGRIAKWSGDGSDKYDVLVLNLLDRIGRNCEYCFGGVGGDLRFAQHLGP